MRIWIAPDWFARTCVNWFRRILKCLGRIGTNWFESDSSTSSSMGLDGCAWDCVDAGVWIGPALFQIGSDLFRPNWIGSLLDSFGLEWFGLARIGASKVQTAPVGLQSLDRIGKH